MIVTVTLNPAVDKTVEIGTFVYGGLNRIRRVICDVGGKGINVSKTLKALGGESIATGFVGGTNGKMIEDKLKESGIQTDFVHISGETRVNTKVFDEKGALTELNEPGTEISAADMELLMNKLKNLAGPDTLFILSGSIPFVAAPLVRNTIYQNLILMAHENGAKVLLDADGEVFRNAVLAIPDMIKPNIVELEKYVGRELSRESLKECCKKFREQGIISSIVSMGSEGAFFCLHDDIAECPALPVKIHSTVGAGDAMVAALAWSWEKHLTNEETIRLCMAVSAGAVMTEGTKPPSREIVEQLLTQVKIIKIG